MTTAAADALEAEIAAVIGAAAAATLCQEMAGQVLYVPRAPGPEHRVSRLIGHDRALLLGEYFSCLKLEFPVGAAKRRAILDLKARGLSNGAIAARLLVTDRFVRKVLAETRDAEADWEHGLFGARSTGARG